MPSFRLTKPKSAAQVAAYVAVALFLAMASCQILIAVGVLPVTIVWGGSQTHRTVQNSLASIVACVILLAMAHVIYSRSQPSPSSGNRIASWIIAFYMALNSLGNFLSPSVVERYIFGSMTVVMCICSFVVATSTELSEDNSSFAPYEVVA